MIDNRSVVDIIYYSAFVKIGLKDSDLKLVTTPLYGFTGDFVMPHGTIVLPLTVEEYPRTLTVMTEFIVVDCSSTFNALLGKPNLKTLKAITSIYYLAMKFPTSEGVRIVKESQHNARECYNVAIRIVDRNKRPL